MTPEDAKSLMSNLLNTEFRGLKRSLTQMDLSSDAVQEIAKETAKIVLPELKKHNLRRKFRASVTAAMVTGRLRHIMERAKAAHDEETKAKQATAESAEKRDA